MTGRFRALAAAILLIFASTMALAEGAAAPSTDLLGRTTDGGVTFNLKTDFGARCDGGRANPHDDTAAIQAWLAKAGPHVHLVAPAGNCVFTAPLLAPTASDFSIDGAGHGATIFTYAGSNTGVDLFTVTTFNPNNCSGSNITLRGFQVRSSTVMTGGDGIRFNSLCNTMIEDVWAGLSLNGDNRLYRGCHFNGGNTVYISKYSCRGSYADEVDNGFSATNNAVDLFHRDGALANGGHYGLLIGGRCGGCIWDNLDILGHPSGANVRIDQSMVAGPNAQIYFLGGFASDGGGSALGVDIEDSGQAAGFPFKTTAAAGWSASAKTLTLAACPPRINNTTVMDMSATPPVVIGHLSACSGGAATLAGDAAFAGKSDDKITVLDGPGVGQAGHQITCNGCWISTTATCLNIGADVVYEIHIVNARIENCPTAGIVNNSAYSRTILSGGEVAQNGYGVKNTVAGGHIEIQTKPSFYNNTKADEYGLAPTIVSGCGGPGPIAGDDYDFVVPWGAKPGTSCVLAYQFQHSKSASSASVIPQGAGVFPSIGASTTAGIALEFSGSLSSGHSVLAHLGGAGF